MCSLLPRVLRAGWTRSIVPCWLWKELPSSPFAQRRESFAQPIRSFLKRNRRVRRHWRSWRRLLTTPPSSAGLYERLPICGILSVPFLAFGREAFFILRVPILLIARFLFWQDQHFLSPYILVLVSIYRA